jgi:hypothetical protein
MYKQFQRPGPAEQQIGESDEAFEAFEAYLSMGSKRTLIKTAEYLEKSRQLMEKWSARWYWKMRVRGELPPTPGPRRRKQRRPRDFGALFQAPVPHIYTMRIPESPRRRRAKVGTAEMEAPSISRLKYVRSDDIQKFALRYPDAEYILYGPWSGEQPIWPQKQ